VESGIDVDERKETAAHEPGADHEHQGDSDFRDHKTAAQSRVTAAGHGPATFAEHR
jgi:hypothetical protein